MRNVSRAWAYETGLAAGVELGPGNKLGYDLLVYSQMKLSRDSRERVLRVFRTGLRIGRQIIKHGRYEYPCIPGAG